MNDFTKSPSNSSISLLNELLPPPPTPGRKRARQIDNVSSVPIFFPKTSSLILPEEAGKFCMENNSNELPLHVSSFGPSLSLKARTLWGTTIEKSKDGKMPSPTKMPPPPFSFSASLPEGDQSQTIPFNTTIYSSGSNLQGVISQLPPPPLSSISSELSFLQGEYQTTKDTNEANKMRRLSSPQQNRLMHCASQKRNSLVVRCARFGSLERDPKSTLKQ